MKRECYFDLEGPKVDRSVRQTHFVNLWIVGQSDMARHTSIARASSGSAIAISTCKLMKFNGNFCKFVRQLQYVNLWMAVDHCPVDLEGPKS